MQIIQLIVLIIEQKSYKQGNGRDKGLLQLFLSLFPVTGSPNFGLLHKTRPIITTDCCCP